MRLYRSFYIPIEAGSTLKITESTNPGFVYVNLDNESCVLSKEAFELLAGLARYSSYGNSINWAGEETEKPNEPLS